MTMTYIKGTFRITGTSPDGDSVRFYPDDPDIWSKSGIKAKANASGGVQLRLDAIDALETHYTPPHGTLWRQPAELGDGAAGALLDLLGFTQVTRDDQGTVTSTTPAERPGYIFTNFADKYGRAVATAYAGRRGGRAADGSSVYVQPDEVLRSVNARLLADGWVYPTFYSQLYVDIREQLTQVAVDARKAGKGVWAQDSTLTGFRLTSRKQLTDELVILPKLFRRLAEYLSLDETGKVGLSRFTEFLTAHNDRLYTVPSGQATSFATLVERNGQTLRLTLPPEQIIFIEA